MKRTLLLLKQISALLRFFQPETLPPVRPWSSPSPPPRAHLPAPRSTSHLPAQTRTQPLPGPRPTLPSPPRGEAPPRAAAALRAHGNNRRQRPLLPHVLCP